MRLREYFKGIAIDLHSPLDPEDVKARINAGSSWGLSPLHTGPVGKVWFDRIRLGYRSTFLEYNMKPILTGRIVAARSGSQLNLRYGAPGGALPFFLLWYFLVAVVFIGAAYSLFTNRDISSGIILLVIPLFAGVPIAFHHWGTNRADEDLAALLEFLRLEAEANPTAN